MSDLIQQAAAGHEAPRIAGEGQKKGAFVTQAAIELALANVDVAIRRVEEFVAPDGYDIVISRAFASLADFAAGALRHAAPHGHLYAMKGAMPDAEIAALPAHVEVVAARSIDVPDLDTALAWAARCPSAARGTVEVRPVWPRD